MEGMVIAPDGRTSTATTAQPPEGKRVLLTGAEGYIGSVLAPRLMEAGYQVDGLDSYFYKQGWLFHDGRDRPRTFCRDTRRVTVEDLRGYDAVVHLAELSNDPICEFDESLTYDINHRGSVTLAEKAKAAGVKRFVYASSCSVYGVAGTEEKTETSDINPQTAYARCKVMVEKDVTALAGKNFSPTFMRNATAFGASPRMRFDIVLNNLAGLAWTTQCIKMTSDGTPWRPLVHVQDISQSIIAVLGAPAEAVHNEVFNVGSSDQNYRVREIAETIGKVFPNCSVEIGTSAGDNRSYRVNFDKIQKHLSGFQCKWNSQSGAEELCRIFGKIAMTGEVFNSAPFTRLKQLKQLQTTGQLDPQLYWATV